MVTEILGEMPPQRYLTAGRRWSFCNAVLDEQSLELLIAGRPAKIDHKPLEVLLYFLNHAGKVVTKEELQESLWAGRIPTESVLTRTISVLRTALGDEDKKIIATVHGFGYRFDAEVTVETSADARRGAFKPREGAALPWKPHWTLARKLGAGGTGEAWLARHDKTGEAVVLKFAESGHALSSFRREAMLSRVLRDSLGPDAPVAQVTDWGLDQEPYYLEIEYVEGQDLQTWAESLGGLPAIALDTRIEIAARIADAIAAVHLVGVFHKDLKPRNVLMDVRAGGLPRIKICDFGSGALLEPELLEQMKITKAGLTESAAAGVTAMYVAPELMAGQRATPRSDLYSFGVMLFQLVAGSFVKPLAPGWEQLVGNPLLIEDIRAAAAGDPGERASDAAQLSARLRSLNDRARRRDQELKVAAKAERSRMILRDLHNARRQLAVMGVLAAMAIAAAFFAHEKGEQAVTATEMAQAINSFLVEDVLRLDPEIEQPRNTSYESLLQKAAAHIDSRFANRPQAAAELHFMLGRRFQEIGRQHMAMLQYKRAVDLETQLPDITPDKALLAEERYANSLFVAGAFDESLERFAHLIQRCGTLHGIQDLSTLLLIERVARLKLVAGDVAGAEMDLRQVLERAPNATNLSPASRGLFREWIGVALINHIAGDSSDEAALTLLRSQTEAALATLLIHFAGDYSEGEKLIRAAISSYEGLLGDHSDLVAENLLELGAALTYQQHFTEAEAVFLQSKRLYAKMLPAGHWLHAAPADSLSTLRYEQGNWAGAVSFGLEGLDLCQIGGCAQLLIEEMRFDLGMALLELGRSAEAVTSIRTSLQVFEQLTGRNGIGTIRRRIALVESLMRSGKLDEAEREFQEIEDTGLRKLPRENHLLTGEYQRVQGLLALHKGDSLTATSCLTSALKILQRRLGDDHWKTRRVADQLKKLGAKLPTSST